MKMIFESNKNKEKTVEITKAVIEEKLKGIELENYEMEGISSTVSMRFGKDLTLIMEADDAFVSIIDANVNEYAIHVGENEQVYIDGKFNAEARVERVVSEDLLEAAQDEMGRKIYNDELITEEIIFGFFKMEISSGKLKLTLIETR